MSIIRYELNKLKGKKPDYAKKKSLDEMTPQERDAELRRREEKLLRQAEELDKQVEAARKRLDNFYGDTDI